MKEILNQEIEIILDGIILKGILSVPSGAKGLVIFAHGSGSGRLSPRNNFVARVLEENALATLLVDLLIEEEELDRGNVFDIAMLSKRLIEITGWARGQSAIKVLPIGYFGASTGAAAALRAAAAMPYEISAIVSRGGRPDLAMEFLAQVTAPTLLIVGGNDDVVIEMNQSAFENIQSEKQMIIIPGAGHLFEEAGALERVADLAARWFLKYFK